MACVIIERTSGLEPLFETTAPKCLKLVAVPSFYLDLLLDGIGTGLDTLVYTRMVVVVVLL